MGQAAAMHDENIALIAASERGAATQSTTVDDPISILIVDDEAKNLTVLETVLSDPSYRLIKAQSAEEALLALLANQFALLILDINMPGVNGIELAQIIRERKKTAQVPIIFLTAYYNEDEHVLAGYDAGAVDYLLKPINVGILRSKVAVFAEMHRMQRQLTTANTKLLIEIIERRSAEEKLREFNQSLEQRVLERTDELRATAALLQTATDGASVGLATFDRHLRYTLANPAYCKIFALDDNAIGQLPQDVLPLDEANEVVATLHRVFEGEQINHEMSRLNSAPEQDNYYSVVYEPERDAAGLIVGVVAVVFDVTDRKQSEEKIRLLLNEVNHRSKNMLSLVSAIARQTTAATREEFIERFLERIQALAASHDLLARSMWQKISAAELVRAQLAHFKDLLDHRIFVSGPSLAFSAQAAQSIGMVLHELATNAVKHGALSKEGGKVFISWQLDEEVDAGHFKISWIERDGPKVTEPKRRGFGSTVIKNMAELKLHGKVQLEFTASGLSWELKCPIAKILDDEREGDGAIGP